MDARTHARTPTDVRMKMISRNQVRANRHTPGLKSAE